jgi:LPXTG-motif cell wall-anchored protein
MKKLLASATAFTLLTVGYSSAAFAAKSPNDTKNCEHFKSQQEAQAFWDQNGYGVGNDPHRLDNDKDGIPCEDYKYPKSTNTTTDNKETTKPQEQTTKKDENKPQEQVKQENAKKETVKQENSNQNNQATNNKQEQTKPQTTAKETKKDTNTVVKKETKKQGEKLPNTASNGVTMMLASLGLALAGSVLMFRRKKTNA